MTLEGKIHIRYSSADENDKKNSPKTAKILFNPRHSDSKLATRGL